MARELSARLGCRYIDTGAMYRAAALAADRERVDITKPAELSGFLQKLVIRQEMSKGSVITFVNGEDVSERIRLGDMGMKASAISALPAVRERLTALQREMGREGGVVLEGRDIGSVVFPDADFKFFLTASAEERAKRRFKELVEKGEPVEFDTVLAEIRSRDRNDSTREAAPLRRVEGAMEIDSTDKGADEVVEEIVRCIERAEAE